MNTIADAAKAYPRSIRRLHWAMALGLLGMVLFGLFMGSLSLEDPRRGLLMRLHLMVGLLLLAAAMLRLRWRLQGRIPDLPSVYGRFEAALARAVHGLFYVLMIGLPLLGLGVWLLDPFVAGPGLAGQSVALGDLAGWLHRAHYLGAWLLLAAVLVHLIGALRGLRSATPERRVLWRMLPFEGQTSRPVSVEARSRPRRSKKRRRS